MVHRALTAALLGLASMLGGCGDDAACEELADICETCPTDGNGPAARASCLEAVSNGNEDDCRERIDGRFYEAFACAP